ncbi:hypothetical protein MASR1M8_00430 [Thermomonas brevis]
MSNALTALSSAISQAIEESKRRERLEYGHIVELSQRALDANEQIIDFLADQKPIDDERAYVAVQLLRASFDHARALLFLLKSNPQDMGASCMALHRAQVESFLRAVFFGFICSQAQIDDFLENDEGPRERTANDKWRKIGVGELAAIVQPIINRLSDEDLEIEQSEKIAQMVRNAWDPLCGFVHGGKAIRAFYRDAHGRIGCDLSPGVLIQTVGNCYAITNFGFLLVLARIYDLPGIASNSPLSNAMHAFVELHHTYSELAA